MTKFKTGEYTMRNGKPAIVCKIRDDGKLLGAAVIGDEWSACGWDANGLFGGDIVYDGLDLVTPLREFWVVERANDRLIFDDMREAELWADEVYDNPGTVTHVREVRND